MVDHEVPDWNLGVLRVRIRFVVAAECVSFDEVVEVAFQSAAVDDINGSVDYILDC